MTKLPGVHAQQQVGLRASPPAFAGAWPSRIRLLCVGTAQQKIEHVGEARAGGNERRAHRSAGLPARASPRAGPPSGIVRLPRKSGPGQVADQLARRHLAVARSDLRTQTESAVAPSASMGRALPAAQARNRAMLVPRSARLPSKTTGWPAASKIVPCSSPRLPPGSADPQLLDLELVGRPLQRQPHRPDGLMAKIGLIDGERHRGLALAGHQVAQAGRELGDAFDRSRSARLAPVMRSRSSQREARFMSSASCVAPVGAHAAR